MDRASGRVGEWASETALVQVRNLSVGYRANAAPAVDDVSFRIAHGETFALVGESGCGKTTTARALLRLVKPTTGEIRFKGIDILSLRGEALRRHRRHMQIVFQDPFTSLNPRMTVGSAIAEGMLAHDMATGPEAAAHSAALLAEVGLHASDGARFPHTLSGGQRQRVAIARALAVAPDLLVLDEAVSSLDVTTQARVLDLFEGLRARRGLTTLFIAHDLAVVQRVASTVAVMYFGRVVEQAPAERLFASPRHPYTRALLSAVPVPDPSFYAARRARVSLHVAHPVLLADDPPRGAKAPRGCSFYARCPHPAKDAACTVAVPPLVAPSENAEPDHVVACIKV